MSVGKEDRRGQVKARRKCSGDGSACFDLETFRVILVCWMLLANLCIMSPETRSGIANSL